jgi:two-component system, OmpR family, sensor histidine kinase MtrB
VCARHNRKPELLGGDVPGRHPRVSTADADPAPRHRLGLRSRVIVAFAGLAFLLSVGLAVFSYELTRAFLVDRRETTARQEAYLNARAVRDALRVNPSDVRGALAQVQTGTDSAVVVRIGSHWFGTSVGVGRDDVPHSLRQLVATGEAGTQNTDLSSTPNVSVGVPLPAVDAAYFQFISVRELDDTLSLLARSLVAAAITATLIGAIVGRYASGRVLRPVRRMAVTASGIGEGALDEKLDAEGDSDLEPLVDAFNSMVSALRNRIEHEARFASDVSHELRTPLATMSAALSVARRRHSAEAAEAALVVLDAELQRFSGLVLDLLEISRMEAGVSQPEREVVDPAQLVRAVLSVTNRDQVAVEIEASAPGTVVLDRRRIGQVLTNLLDNADAYGGGATAIIVAGTPESLLIAVDDAGPGIAPEEREYIFERFARGEASESKPGTGLGLALVVEHVRLHGGQAWVGESPGGGARFVIELPRSPE